MGAEQGLGNMQEGVELVAIECARNYPLHRQTSHTLSILRFSWYRTKETY